MSISHKILDNTPSFCYNYCVLKLFQQKTRCLTGQHRKIPT